MLRPLHRQSGGRDVEPAPYFAWQPVAGEEGVNMRVWLCKIFGTHDAAEVLLACDAHNKCQL